MAERWVVLGGWSFDPEILRPVFGDRAILYDTNLLMPAVAADGTLRHDWRDEALRLLKPHFPSPPFGLAGWSTGAIVAWAVAPRLRPARLAMLSATPSFCRCADLRHGTRPAVLERMRAALLTDPRAVLNSFTERCGLEGARGKREYSCDTLAAGLTFLRQATLLPIEPLSLPVRFLHGTDDLIVPADAGRAFACMAGAPLAEIPGGHGFFTRDPRGVRERIEEVAI